MVCDLRPVLQGLSERKKGLDRALDLIEDLGASLLRRWIAIKILSKFAYNPPS
jgi:hypothetical protein